MFSPTPRNLHNRIFARNNKLNSAAAAPPPRAVAVVANDVVSNPTNCDDFGDLLKDQQLAVLQSHCRSLEAELAEQQQLLQVELKRSAAAESQCLQLQHMHQQHTELMAVMRKDLHRALSTVQAVTARCSQLIRDRNAFRDQKRSFEQLIGSFVSGVTSVGAHAPQHLHDAVDNFAVVSQQSLAQEANDMEDGNKELMELLRSIWGNADGDALARGEQPTPAVARVARDFQMGSSTPGTQLVKELLPHFASNPLLSTPAHAAESCHVEGHAAAADSDLDDINRFLNSRVACIIHNGSSSAVQIAAQCATDTAASNSDACGAVTHASAAVGSTAALRLPSNQAPALPQVSAVSSATTSTSAAPDQYVGSQASVPKSYEELQMQLHTGTASSPAGAAKQSSNDGGVDSGSEAARASAVQLKAAALLDPAHDSETQHHMTVQPVAQGLLQSSPHSSSDSLASMLPIETMPSQPQATSAAATAGYSIASNAQSPGISSPRTYEELQIALQRGYTRTSPKIEQKSASADFSPGNGSSDSATRAMRDKQSSQSRAQSGLKEAGKKPRSKHTTSSSQSSDNGQSIGSSGSKMPVAAVGTFNLPSSFFS